MVNDPIADMLTRLRNAALARLERTEVPFSRLKVNVTEILKQEGFVSDYRVEEDERRIIVFLKYSRNRASAFAGLRRASRPGRRHYVGHQEIPKVRNGLGIAILSTSHGVMTDRAARAAKVGGEILCEVW
jgi:small subunit ribosomal protein S8